MLHRLRLTGLLIFILSISGFHLQAQTEIISDEDMKNVLEFSVVEKVPVAKGCDSELDNIGLRNCFNRSVLNHIAHNFNYPKEDRKAGVQGKVYVNFIIEKDASISNVKVVRGVSPTLDAEAIRVIQGIEVSEPAYQRGKPVRMSFTVPINARLQ